MISNGESRFYKEIDIVNLLNTIRLFKVYFTRSLPPEKRMLLQLQRSQIIESTSQDDHDKVWDQDQEYLAQIFNRKDPIKGVLGLGYVSRTFRSYWKNINKVVDDEDKLLLQGFYTAPNLIQYVSDEDETRNEQSISPDLRKMMTHSFNKMRQSKDENHYPDQSTVV